jgi:hypothetical protein
MSVAADFNCGLKPAVASDLILSATHPFCTQSHDLQQRRLEATNRSISQASQSAEFQDTYRSYAYRPVASTQ